MEEERYHYSSGSSDEEEYAAAADSDIEDMQEAPELGNVVAFSGRTNVVETQDSSISFAGRGILPQDNRLLVLFDLNGVLVHHGRQFTGKGITHTHALRPGVHHLLRLSTRCRVGVYTSATRRTVEMALSKLQDGFTQELEQLDPEASAQFPFLTASALFDVILCRDHCVLATAAGLQREGGKPWDTVKPLGKYFRDLSRVVLVDDSPHKSLPHEASNMLVMPMWQGPDHDQGDTDAALPDLVDALLQMVETGFDARTQVPRITIDLQMSARQASGVEGAVHPPVMHPGHGTDWRSADGDPVNGDASSVPLLDVWEDRSGPAPQLQQQYQLAAACTAAMPAPGQEQPALTKKEKGSKDPITFPADTIGLQYLATDAPWECTICGLTCSSQMVLLSHAQGVKHKKKVESKSAVVQVPNNIQGAQFLTSEAPWTCTLCEVTCTNHANLITHARGAKHLKKLSAAVESNAALPAVARQPAQPPPPQPPHGGHYLRSHDQHQTPYPPHPTPPPPAHPYLQGSQDHQQHYLPGPPPGFGFQPTPEYAPPNQPAIPHGGYGGYPSGQYIAPPPQQQHQSMQMAVPRDGSKSTLHHEVASFAHHATPTPQEVSDVQAAVSALDNVARSLWPSSHAVLFGSQATGLALPGADLDIAILGVGIELQRAGSGFTSRQRKAVSEQLEDLLDALLQTGLISGNAQIIEARIPIIKCRMAFGIPPGLSTDISLGVSNGAAAVEWVRQQIIAVPPLQPLCLVAKGLLRDRGFNEVFTGGLGSYALVNMVLAHLQAVGYAADLAPLQGSGGLPPGVDMNHTFDFLMHLAHGNLPAYHATQQQQQQRRQPQAETKEQQLEEAVDFIPLNDNEPENPDADGIGEDIGPNPIPGPIESDLGILLWSFFRRFGTEFNYAGQAISVRLGGLTNKVKAWRVTKKPWLLAVEDPQEPGRDIGAGTFNIREIGELFAGASDALAEACEVDFGPIDEQHQVDDTQREDGGLVASTPHNQQQHLHWQHQPFEILLSLLDVEGALGRSELAMHARHQMELRSADAQATRRNSLSHLGKRVGKRSSMKRLTKRQRKELQMAGDEDIDSVYSTKGKHRKVATLSPGVAGGGVNKKRGTKKSRAVHGAWGNSMGQFLNDPDLGASYGRDQGDGPNTRTGNPFKTSKKAKAKAKKIKAKAKQGGVEKKKNKGGKNKETTSAKKKNKGQTPKK